MFTDISEVLAASNIRSTSETSVNFYQTTWRNKPVDSHLHTRHCQNLKSHMHCKVSWVKAFHNKAAGKIQYRINIMGRGSILINIHDKTP
jgi:hypothetical protein